MAYTKQSFRAQGTPRTIRGKTGRRIKQRWKQYQPRRRGYRKYRGMQRRGNIQAFQKMLLKAKESKMMLISNDVTPGLQDKAAVYELERPTLSNLMSGCTTIAIFDRAHAALIVKGDRDTQRIGDQIQLRGIKLQLRMTPVYDGYDAADATTIYQQYRLVVYAVRYRIVQELNLANTTTYLTPHVLDVNTLPYRYTNNPQDPHNYRSNNQDIKILYQQYIEFFPQGAINETPSGVAIQSARYVQQNIYTLDTFIKFPCKIQYYESAGAPTPHTGWQFHVRIMSDMEVDNWVNPTLPFAGPGVGGFTQNRFTCSLYAQPYWKDLD